MVQNNNSLSFKRETKYCIILALCVLFTGCMSGGPSRIPVPPPEYYAIRNYERIASNANALHSTDRINWVPGRTEPERVSVECKTKYCKVGYSLLLYADKVVDVFADDLTLTGEVNGVSTALEDWSSESGFADTHTYGGWMQYSFFASTVVRWQADFDPAQGVQQVYATVTGESTFTNPTMEATWTGGVSARDDTAGVQRDSYVRGESSITVSIGSEVLADVHLSALENATTGQAYADIAFEDLAVSDGQFSRYHADNHRVSGTFYGPEHEEVGGVFEHPQGLLGSFGANRN